MKTLYVCYFGLREPLVQTQVLPYLRELAAAGVEVYLLTFERQKRPVSDLRSEIAALRTRLDQEGIKWYALPYHKTPTVPATLFDIFAGAWTALRLIRRNRIDVIHARAHIPMAMALLLRRLTKCRLVFDIRGLMAEEYADAGVWAKDSLKFKTIKRLERAGIKAADQIVVLTRTMRDWLVKEFYVSDKIEVIPCCVDFARYSGAEFMNEAERSRFEIIYAGSVIGLYMLEEMAAFFSALQVHEPRAFFRILTMSPADEVSERLRRLGLNPEHFSVGEATAQEVPRYLSRARLGISFRKPTFSQIAASPTKIPEYLAAGLPVVSNAGIGDVDGLLESERVGVVIKEFTAAELARAAEEALDLAADDEVSARCVDVARRYFDLNTVGAQAYIKVYRRIGETVNSAG